MKQETYDKVIACLVDVIDKFSKIAATAEEVEALAAVACALERISRL